MKILLTGFEPFGSHWSNISWEVARLLQAEARSGCDVRSLMLPVSYERAWEELKRELIGRQYDCVLMLGLAAKRTDICLERLAINIDDADMADNDGIQRSGMLIERESPAAYFTTLPIIQMREVLNGQGYHVKISNNAGSYVCNHLYFQALHWAKLQENAPEMGFVHLPDNKTDLMNENLYKTMSSAIEFLAADFK